MPIYEYSCPKCGRFEVMQRASEDALVAKPECDCADCPKAAQRLISASAFHLKGSGWYKTDYKPSGSAGTAASASSSSSESKAESSNGSAGSSNGSDSGGSSDSGTKSGGGCGGSCSCH